MNTMSATVLAPTYLAKTGYEVLQQAGLNIIEVPNVDNATLLKYIKMKWRAPLWVCHQLTTKPMPK